MKKVIFIVCFSFLFSCDKDDDYQDCAGGPDAIWLESFKNEIDENCCADCACVTKIFQGKYEGDIVFYERPTGGLCDAVYRLEMYDCGGNLVQKLTQSETYNYMVDEGIDDEIIYSCRDSEE